MTKSRYKYKISDLNKKTKQYNFRCYCADIDPPDNVKFEGGWEDYIYWINIRTGTMTVNMDGKWCPSINEHLFKKIINELKDITGY
jgi:hypothetical protein